MAGKVNRCVYGICVTTQTPFISEDGVASIKLAGMRPVRLAVVGSDLPSGQYPCDLDKDVTYSNFRSEGNLLKHFSHCQVRAREIARSNPWEPAGVLDSSDCMA